MRRPCPKFYTLFKDSNVWKKYTLFKDFSRRNFKKIAFSRIDIFEPPFSRTDQFQFFGHNFGSICPIFEIQLLACSARSSPSFQTPFLAKNAIFDTLNTERTFRDLVFQNYPFSWFFRTRMVTLFKTKCPPPPRDFRQFLSCVITDSKLKLKVHRQVLHIVSVASS